VSEAADAVTLQAIREAAERIAGGVVRTPLVPCGWAEPDRPLWIKPESLQPTGAFKTRGALNAVAQLDAAQRASGVVADSSGNHAQALAYAARQHGVPATIVIPEGSAPMKIAATERLGAEVLIVPRAERSTAARRLAAERGLTPIPPYDHPWVIAGQGTVGLEIADDLPDVDVVLVPVSGGGLISGTAVAVLARCPNATVIGVEPALAADARESLRAGSRVEWTPERTFRTAADGLRVTVLGEVTWPYVRRLVTDIVTVTEDEIVDAVRVLARGSRLVAEPSGAVTTAAYLHHSEELPPGRTVAVLSGGNVDQQQFAAMLAG
jgi:threonine dehydratase